MKKSPHRHRHGNNMTSLMHDLALRELILTANETTQQLHKFCRHRAADLHTTVDFIVKLLQQF